VGRTLNFLPDHTNLRLPRRAACRLHHYGHRTQTKPCKCCSAVCHGFTCLHVKLSFNNTNATADVFISCCVLGGVFLLAVVYFFRLIVESTPVNAHKFSEH
jgi:hypothetical protein